MDIASKKENLDKKAVAEDAEKKRFYLFNYDERPKHISNPGRLKNALHPDGFLLIVSHPGSLQKVFKKLNGHFEYLWTIAVAAEHEYVVDGMWVESKWRAITIWAHKIPLHLTFEDTLGLNSIDNLQDLGEYIKELRYTFDRTEDTEINEDEMEDIDIEDTGMQIIKAGEI
jgi:hypothetical protein